MNSVPTHRALTVQYRIKRTIQRLLEGVFHPVGLLRRSLILMPALIFPVVFLVSPCQGQEREAKDPPSELTDEEKEIINNREILENLPLLQSLDKIEFIGLLNEMEPDWSEEEDTDKPEEKNEEGKMP